MDRLRRHLTYANVTATLALFIALGGSSYAALSLTGRDIKDGSLTHRELKRNTLGGTKIKESRLGKVRRARNADRLNGLRAERFLLRCPTDTVPVSDVCVETVPRPAAPYTVAAVILEEGPRMTSLLVDTPADTVRCDMQVEVAWQDAGEVSMPYFRATR